MNEKDNIPKSISIISFILYLLILSWIILFKFRFDFSNIKYIRSINLIPFKANGTTNGMSETFINLLLFIPLGIYLQYLIKDKKIRIILIPLISIVYEVMQYVLHVGVSDITDVIMNTLGGIIGLCLMLFVYIALTKIMNRNKADSFLGYMSILIPISILGMLFII